MSLIALLFLISAACTSGPQGPGSRPERRKEAKHEHFLVHPTVVRAETVRAIFPMQYRNDVSVQGLSAGWKDEGSRRTWKGTGRAEVRLGQLVLSGRSVTVTLVAGQPAPEVLVQADGNVAFGHSSNGVMTEWEGKSFLLIRNDEWLEK